MNNSVEQMWRAYLKTLHETVETTNKTYTAWCFCDNETDANELAELVKQGQKRATASALWSYEKEQEPIPQVGELSVILNWAGEAQCIIRTTSVEIVAYDEVTAVFAATEGEGDGSLDYWRRAHWAFFTRDLANWGLEPTKTMPVICEVFEVVYKPSD